MLLFKCPRPQRISRQKSVLCSPHARHASTIFGRYERFSRLFTTSEFSIKGTGNPKAIPPSHHGDPTTEVSEHFCRSSTHHYRTTFPFRVLRLQSFGIRYIYLCQL